MAYEKLLPIVMCFIKTLNTPFTVACYPSYQGRLRGVDAACVQFGLGGKKLKECIKIFILFFILFSTRLGCMRLLAYIIYMMTRL